MPRFQESGEELYLFEDSQMPPILPFHQLEQANPPLHLEIQNTFNPEPAVQSACSVFPGSTQHIEIDLNDSVEIVSSVLPANVTNDTNEPTDIAGTPCLMNRVVFRRDANRPENSSAMKCSSRKNQFNRQAQYPDRKETGNNLHLGKKGTFNRQQPTCPIQQSPNKLFGILSLILQAFNSPLTAELEECFTGVLQS